MSFFQKLIPASLAELYCGLLALNLLLVLEMKKKIKISLFPRAFVDTFLIIGSIVKVYPHWEVPTRVHRNKNMPQFCC